MMKAEQGDILKIASLPYPVVVVSKNFFNESGLAMAIKTDITKRADVFAAAEKIEKEWGKLDIWVNCAGYSKILPFLECTDEIWDKTIDINLRGCFLGCQAAITHMNPAGGAIGTSFSPPTER